MLLRRALPPLLAAALLSVLAPGPALAGTPADDGARVVDRVTAADPYATSAAVSADAFAPGVPVAYVASGADYPDALAGTAAAGQQGAPVLLTRPDALPGAVATELARLAPGRIVVLGGPEAVSDAVTQALGAYTRGAVTRLAGDHRFATAATVSAQRPSAGTVYVASGRDFPDALSAGAVAGPAQAPVLLVTPTVVPDETLAELRRLAPRRIVVLGGEEAVGTGVVAALEQTGARVTRMAGADRYETSAAMSAQHFPDGAETVYLADGWGFADALSGAPAASLAGAPVLLARPGGIPPAVRAELARLTPDRVVLVGDVATDAVALQAAGQAVKDVITDPAPSEPDGTDSGADSGAEQGPETDQLTRMLNDFRAANGRHALIRDPHLDAIAQGHAQWMAENRTMQHNPTYRQQMGPGWRTGSEIIVRYRGYEYLREPVLPLLHDWWRNSPVHRENMLRASFTHVGTGYYLAHDVPYAVHVFGG